MGVAGDLLLAAAGTLVVIMAPLEVAFGALVVFWLLVPGTLVVPHLPHIVLADRLVLYAFAGRLLARFGRPGEPGRGAYAVRPVHSALAVLLVVGYFDGVVAAPRTTSLAGDLHGWLSMLDLAVLFVVSLAVLRTIGLWRAARIVVITLMIAVVIGFAERFTGHGWSHFFFEGLPTNYLAPGATLLARRGGHPRSQAAAQFALEYGWVLAALLPLVLVVAMRWSRSPCRGSWLALLIPVAVVAAIVFSASRSAEVGAVAGSVVFVLAAGAGRRLWAVAIIGAVAAAAFVLADPSIVTAPFSTAAAADPASVRLDRLPVLFSFVVHRPFTGLGYDFGSAATPVAGTSALNPRFGGIDDAYALLYATVGMLGLISWLSLLVAAFAAPWRAAMARRESIDRAFGAACLIGVAAMVIACAAYDVISTLQSMWTIVVLAAVGTCASEVAPERARSRAPRHRRWGLRLLLPLYGVAFGFGILASAPSSASQSLSVLAVAPYVSAFEKGPFDDYTGTTLVNTLCSAITNPREVPAHTSVTCDQASPILPANPPGLALVTVRAPTPSAVRRETRYAFTTIFANMPLAGGPSGPIEVGKPALAVTAPVWGAAIGLLAMFFLPPLPPIRRRKKGAVPDKPVAPATGFPLAQPVSDPPRSGVGHEPAVHQPQVAAQEGSPDPAGQLDSFGHGAHLVAGGEVADDRHDALSPEDLSEDVGHRASNVEGDLGHLSVTPGGRPAGEAELLDPERTAANPVAEVGPELGPAGAPLVVDHNGGGVETSGRTVA